MNKASIELPYVIFGANPDSSERYAVFTEMGECTFTNRLSDASRFPTARMAYEFAGQRRPFSSTLRYRTLQDYRVGRRTY